jgi:ABC-type multidrug transport system permease subunit
MVPFVIIVAGFALGVAIGRWWALLAALALGLFAGVTDETELADWAMGIYFGLPAGIGIASGVVTRRVLARRRRAARV